MQIIIICLLLLINLVLGFSFLKRIYKGDKVRYDLADILLSIILGYGICTLVIFFMDAFFIPIKGLSIWLILLSISGGLIYRDVKNGVNHLKLFKVKFSLFDVIPFILILGFGFISIWRTTYYPPYSYDSMMGIDIIAKYAARDGHIAGSELFKEIVPRNGVYSNQLFYAPFTMLNQVLYRVVGITFGQVWLGLLSTCFWLYFYLEAKKLTHAVFAVICTLFIISAPELFAYSFILQTDWSNAIYFFVGVLFFYKYFQSDKISHLYISMAGMFLACWTRTETLFFIPFGALYILLVAYFKTKKITKELFILPVLYTAIPFLAVAIWNFIYVKLYLPSKVDLMNQMDLNFGNLFSDMATSIQSMNSVVVFNDAYWGYIVTAFLLVLVISIPFAFKTKKYEGIEILLWLVILYVVFVFIITQFPAVTIKNTFRRGFFKFIPLFALFIAASPFSQWLNRVFVGKA